MESVDSASVLTYAVGTLLGASLVPLKPKSAAMRMIVHFLAKLMALHVVSRRKGDALPTVYVALMVSHVA